MSARQQLPAFDWVYDDINFWTIPGTHLIATIQWRMGSQFPLFTDHNVAVHIQRIQSLYHGFCGGLVGFVLSAEAHPAACGQSRRFSDSHQIKT
jgi:hypothetical protein